MPHLKLKPYILNAMQSKSYFLCVLTVKFPCGVGQMSKRIYVRSLDSIRNSTKPDKNVTRPSVPITNRTINQMPKGKITPSRLKLPPWFYNSTERVTNRTRIIGGDSASPGEVPWQVQRESGQFDTYKLSVMLE